MTNRRVQAVFSGLGSLGKTGALISAKILGLEGLVIKSVYSMKRVDRCGVWQ